MIIHNTGRMPALTSGNTQGDIVGSAYMEFVRRPGTVKKPNMWQREERCDRLFCRNSEVWKTPDRSSLSPNTYSFGIRRPEATTGLCTSDLGDEAWGQSAAEAVLFKTRQRTLVLPKA